MALGSLVSCCNHNWDVGERWSSSDIDVYVYGLSASEATTKIRSIYETFRSNLSNRIHMPTLAVRNSKTITFYTSYPLRRIQIVLKLVESPKDVLLNFDLDICAVGWDGSKVWMLPRAARALESSSIVIPHAYTDLHYAAGSNVFTMHLIRGHYLSERRASQPQR